MFAAVPIWVCIFNDFDPNSSTLYLYQESFLFGPIIKVITVNTEGIIDFEAGNKDDDNDNGTSIFFLNRFLFLNL